MSNSGIIINIVEIVECKSENVNLRFCKLLKIKINNFLTQAGLYY